MELPLEIIFHNMDPSPALEAHIRDKAQKLLRFFDPILRCRVVVEFSGRRHHQGKLHQVGITVAVPGRDIVANQHPSQRHAHEDIMVAVGDAFDAVRRELEDHARRQRGGVKTHEAKTVP